MSFILRKIIALEVVHLSYNFTLQKGNEHLFETLATSTGSRYTGITGSWGEDLLTILDAFRSIGKDI